MSQRGVSKKVSLDDRSSVYKTKSRGIGDRLVRGIRFQEERKQSRMNEIDKRRRTPLSPLQNGNRASTIQEMKKIKQDTIADTKEKQVVDKRREKLLKWREEKLLRRKAEELEKAKKKAFVVKHVTYLPPAISTLPKQNGKKKTASVNESGKKNGPKCIADTTSSCGTRTSARLANKAVKERVGKYSKDTGCSVKTKKQVVENKSRTTRSTASKKTKQVSAAVQPAAPRTRMTTRYQQVPPTVPAETTRTGEIVDKNKTTTEDCPTQGNDLTKIKPNNITFSSIIPNNFSFKAPVGLNSFTSLGTSFTFEPMSPSSAEKFMFPSASSVFNDVPVTMSMVEAEKVGRQESLGKNMDGVDGEKKGERVLGEEHLSKEGADCAMKDNQISSIGGINGDNCNGVNMNASEKKPGSVVDTVATVDEEAAAAYFQSLVDTETNRMQDLCSLWQKVNDGEDMPPDEVQGSIRTAIGQVQLLVTKKFKQFRGLIERSEDPNAERKTLNSDLQGFWDMIYFQVEDIDRKFKKLEELKMNNWKEVEKDVKKVIKKKAIKKTPCEKLSKIGAKAADTRNKFREMRAQMKVKLQEKGNDSQEAFKMVLMPVENKKSRIEQGEAELVLTPVRRSTRKSLSSQPHVVSTPKQQQDFELRLTPTSDEEPSCAEGGANELMGSGVDLKDGKEEIEQEAVSIDAISESADIPVDTTSAEFSSKNFEPAQTSSVDTQHSTGGSSPTGVSTTAVVPTGILTNPCVLLSTSEEEQGKNVSVKSSGRKRRCTRSSRVMFTCSTPSEELAGTQSKRSCRSTPSRRRIPTPFSDKTRRMDDNVSSSSDVTETSSKSERTEDEDEKTPRRMSSNKKMTKRQSCSKKHDTSEIETPKRNLAAEVEKEANESCNFGLKYLQPSPDILANEQVDNVKTPTTSLYTSCVPSQSELVTPTPSKLTKTPMPDTTFTPTLRETNDDLTLRDESYKASAQASTPCTMLTNFHLDESGNESELINDSTFFPRDNPAAQSTDEVNVSPTANLIFFSPTTPLKRACKEETVCGSVKKFAPVTPSKKLETFLGADVIFSPVRRSARIEANHSQTPKRPAFHSLSDIPDDTDFGYVPNKALV